MMNKRTQLSSTPKKGQALTASSLAQMSNKTRDLIVAGKGILIRRMGDQTLIEAKPIGKDGGSSGGGAVYEAATYPALPDVSTVASKSRARVTGGDQAFQIYKVGYIGGVLAWVAVGETYEADTKAELTNNEYVQQFALGRTVDGTHCIRNIDNDGWDDLRRLE